jgi:hypothetical protein
MSKRRTRKDKVEAKHQYQLGNWYQKPAAGLETPAMKPAPEAATARITAMTLYGYEPSLIRGDIIKTIIVAGIILAVEIGLYVFWR